jgi:hypothetical protein
VEAFGIKRVQRELQRRCDSKTWRTLAKRLWVRWLVSRAGFK